MKIKKTTLIVILSAVALIMQVILFFFKQQNDMKSGILFPVYGFAEYNLFERIKIHYDKYKIRKTEFVFKKQSCISDVVNKIKNRFEISEKDYVCNEKEGMYVLRFKNCKLKHVDIFRKSVYKI